MRTLFLMGLLLSSIIVFGQEKIETDRPDQTETPFTVPKKFFQAEFGFNKENISDDAYQWVHPTALLKYGISNKLEFRLETNFGTETIKLNDQKFSSTILEPVEIGAKLSLFEEKGLLPKTSLIAHVGLPFLASKEVKPDDLPFIARISMQNSISKDISLGYNFGIEKNGFDAMPNWFYTLAPGFNLGEKWYAYVEVFGFIKQNELPDHNLDGGIAYFISNNVKIDLSAGLGLSPASIKNYVALGFSFRLPIAK